MFFCRSSCGWNSGIHVFLDLKLGARQRRSCLLWDDILPFLKIKSLPLWALSGRIKDTDLVMETLDTLIIWMRKMGILKAFRSCGIKSQGVLVLQNRRCFCTYFIKQFYLFISVVDRCLVCLSLQIICMQMHISLKINYLLISNYLTGTLNVLVRSNIFFKE